MSETKRTPLPWFWLDRDLVHKDSDETHHVVLDDGSAAGEYAATIDPAGPDAKLIVTSVNARPKVEELVRAAKELAMQSSGGLTEDCNCGGRHLNCKVLAKAREVEAALGGKEE